MNETLLAKLQTRFQGLRFERFYETDHSHFGWMERPVVKTRDRDKTLLRVSWPLLFISSEMYPGTDGSFFYAILYQLAEYRPYRHKNWGKKEMNKLFVSGKTLNDVVAKLVAAEWSPYDELVTMQAA